MDRDEGQKYWYALLQARVDGDEAAEKAAHAALAPARAEFRNETKSRVKAMGKRLAAAARNDNA